MRRRDGGRRHLRAAAGGGAGQLRAALLPAAAFPGCHRQATGRLDAAQGRVWAGSAFGGGPRPPGLLSRSSGSTQHAGDGLCAVAPSATAHFQQLSLPCAPAHLGDPWRAGGRSQAGDRSSKLGGSAGQAPELPPEKRRPDALRSRCAPPRDAARTCPCGAPAASERSSHSQAGQARPSPASMRSSAQGELERQQRIARRGRQAAREIGGLGIFETREPEFTPERSI